MRKRIYIFTAILCIFVFGSPAIASNVKFEARVSKTNLKVGEKFKVEFSVNSSGSGFNAPDLSDFRVYSGPNHSTSMRYVNGSMSTRISYSYILAPRKKGELTIGPASIKVGGEILKTDPVNLKVSGNASAQQQSGSGSTHNANKAEGGKGLGDELFIKAYVTKTDAYVGEALTLTHKLYNRTKLVDLQLEKMPAYTGFWSQSLSKDQQQIRWKRVNYNGKQYDAGNINQDLLFPQRPGKLKVEPMQVSSTVRERSKKKSRSLLEQFFGSYKNVQYPLSSNHVEINVKPLPEEGKPDNFKGAVGSFDLEVTADNTEVKANEAIRLRVKISGTGNIPLVDPPEIDFPADFEVYDPEIKDETSSRTDGVSGTRTYEYLIIPRHKGEFEIPAVSYSYFDPGRKKYHELSSAPIQLKIAEGEGGPATSTSFPGVNKEDVKVLGRDIRYIKTGKAGMRKKGDYFISSTVFYVLSLIPLILLVLAYLFRKKYREMNRDAVTVRKRKASKVASKRLTAAKKELDANDEKAFYEEVFKALYGYVGDKLNIPVANLNKENIVTHLKRNNIPDETVNELMNTIDHCEMARFSPSSALSTEDVYGKASAVITAMEQHLKKV